MLANAQLLPRYRPSTSSREENMVPSEINTWSAQAPNSLRTCLELTSVHEVCSICIMPNNTSLRTIMKEFFLHSPRVSSKCEPNTYLRWHLEQLRLQSLGLSIFVGCFAVKPLINHASISGGFRNNSRRCEHVREDVPPREDIAALEDARRRGQARFRRRPSYSE